MNNSIYVKKVHWDSTKDPIEYPEKIKDIFFKLFIKNRKKFTKWVSKTVSKNFDDLIKLPFGGSALIIKTAAIFGFLQKPIIAFSCLRLSSPITPPPYGLSTKREPCKNDEIFLEVGPVNPVIEIIKSLFLIPTEPSFLL